MSNAITTVTLSLDQSEITFLIGALAGEALEAEEKAEKHPGDDYYRFQADEKIALWKKVRTACKGNKL